MTTPERPSDAAPTTVPLVRGRTASVVDEGEGPAFLLVHGIPGSARDFRWLSPCLVAEGVRAIRVEMPGFGGTPLATEPSPSVEARARYVLDVMDALELEAPVIVGHSMGGVIGTMAAHLAPDRVRGLSLVSSPGLRPHQGLRRFPAKRIALVLRIPGARRLLAKRIERGFVRSGFRGHPHAALVHTIRCVAALDIDAHASRLHALRVPTQVAFCEDDPLIELPIFEALADAVSGPVARYATGGHNPQKAWAVELAQALVGWASTLRP